MKKIVFFLLLVAVSSYGQELSRLSLHSMSLDEKSFIQSNGFPLTNYSFDNSSINTELNTAILNIRKGKKLRKYAIIGSAAGLLVAVTASGDNLDDVVAQRALGLGMIVGGTMTFYIGHSKKQKAIKKIQNASYQYSALKQ